MYRIRNPAYSLLYRGFESLPLRQYQRPVAINNIARAVCFDASLADLASFSFIKLVDFLDDAQSLVAGPSSLTAVGVITYDGLDSRSPLLSGKRTITNQGLSRRTTSRSH
jgi:hypothetical protein